MSSASEAAKIMMKKPERDAMLEVVGWANAEISSRGLSDTYCIVFGVYTHLATGHTFPQGLIALSGADVVAFEPCAASECTRKLASNLLKSLGISAKP